MWQEAGRRDRKRRARCPPAARSGFVVGVATAMSRSTLACARQFRHPRGTAGMEPAGPGNVKQRREWVPPPSAHPARSKPRAGIRQRRARHRSRRRLRAVPCRRRPRPAQSLAAQQAGTHHRHIRPQCDSRGDSRLRWPHRAARHRPRYPAAVRPAAVSPVTGCPATGRRVTGRTVTGPAATARTRPRPAAHGGRRRLGARVPRRRLRGRRHRRGRYAVAAPGGRVARGRDRAGTAPWRAGARLRGLAHLRYGRARRAAPLAAPDRRAQRRRGARAVA